MATSSFTSLAALLVFALLINITEPKLTEEERQNNAEGREYIHNLIRTYCPVNGLDGSICENDVYKDFENATGWYNKAKKVRSMTAGYKTKEAHYATEFCCTEKKCILECRRSSVLAGWPGNMKLLQLLDNAYFQKRPSESFKPNNIDVWLFKSTDHFERRMMSRYGQLMSIEQIQHALRTYGDMFVSKFAMDFPYNFYFLDKLDGSVFKGMDPLLKADFSCARKTEGEDADFWKIMVSLNENRLEQALNSVENFEILETYREC